MPDRIFSTMPDKKAEFLLSTDSLSGYGLDLIFQIAKNTGFDGLDLAIWKNFDSWNIKYVKKLIEQYQIPVRVIQLSSDLNIKEMTQALELAREVLADTITINPPTLFNWKAYSFIANNIVAYKRSNPKLKISLINPPKENMFGVLPIPKYRFTNIIEIIKKYDSYLAFDIANVDENTLETSFLKRLGNFVPYLSVVYVSDKLKTGEGHIPLGNGVLKLPTILKKFKMHEFRGYFSLKITLSKQDLSDSEKVELILKKSRVYFKENYEELIIV